MKSRVELYVSALAYFAEDMKSSVNWASFPSACEMYMYLLLVFTMQCYASAVYAVIVCLSVCLSVSHMLVLYRNDLTDKACFWHGSFL